MIMVLISVAIGLIIGIFSRDILFLTRNISDIIEYILFIFLFFVGIDLGQSANLYQKMREIPRKVLFLPFIIIIASLIGGAICSFIPSISLAEGVAVSSGMGWYSFSGVELSKVSAELGGIAFLANIFRELIAIVFIPFISQNIGGLEAISSAGATAMDSVLPIINKSNSKEISMIAFYSGLVISIIVPFLVPFIVVLFKL